MRSNKWCVSTCTCWVLGQERQHQLVLREGWEAGVGDGDAPEPLTIKAVSVTGAFYWVGGQGGIFTVTHRLTMHAALPQETHPAPFASLGLCDFHVCPPTF